LDLVFPDVDGLESARILKDANSDIAVIALTTSVRDYHFNQCLNAGCDECIIKTEIIYKLIPVITNLTKK
jgi:CheY-like chemotaxis protein